MGAPAGWYDDGSGRQRWWDGVQWTEFAPPPRNEFDAPPPRRRMSSGGKAALFAVLAVVLIVAGVVTFALATARHWTKVDVPEQAETFHTEQYETGLFIVVDNGVSPCYEGQDWYACRNSMVDEYNRECYDRELTAEAAEVCRSYSDELDRMEEVATAGATVATVGGFGYLEATAEVATRAVSNNDYRAAVTHEAVCYLGFLGECDGVDAADLVDVGPGADATPTPAPTEADSPVGDEDVDAEIDDAVAAVGGFWARHFSEYWVGAQYRAPAIGGAYTSARLPDCGGEELLPYNAYYCGADHTLWWDADLMREFYSAGDANIYLIVAHEWGHAIQAQIEGVWEAEELQADCLAAAAIYGAAEDGSVTWESGDTAEITNGLTALADDTAWTDSDDHGDPLDRIAAFNDGRAGVEGCYAVGE